MEPVLWPARNVAEYAYCPRLFYLMEVEGIHVASHDTEEGNRVHKRVDAPSHDKQAATDNAKVASEPRSVRSLTLTSPMMQLTATLDLAEIDGHTAIPVEYRKGRPRRLAIADDDEPYEPSLTIPDSEPIDFEPWPTDRIQLGLQVLLLEEAGYTVPYGILYYASIRRHIKVAVDDNLRTEARQTLTSARACAVDTRPAPLVNDPRCPRCSLHSICLPDEINCVNDSHNEKPRNLWPPRDDGIHLVGQTPGTRIGVNGATLRVTDPDKMKPTEVPLANLESLSLLGSVQVSTQALHTLADRKVPVAFLSAAGRMIAMVDPLDSVSAKTRRNQVRVFDRPEKCAELARALVVAKIRNQRTLLMRNHKAVPSRVTALLAEQAAAVEKAGNIDTIRGHEGQAAALYFEQFAGMLNEEFRAEFDANGRQRRPPPDPINSCLSFAYSMLTHEATASLRTARLEPAIGAFHVDRPGRPALALDLMEPFRSVIADSLTIAAFNRGELRPGHFVRTAAGCLFTDAGRRAFFGIYSRRMNDQVTHPVFGYKLEYRRMIILHARMIAAWINGEVSSLSFLTTR